MSSSSAVSRQPIIHVCKQLQQVLQSRNQQPDPMNGIKSLLHKKM